MSATSRLASLHDDGWTLDCGESLHAEYPDTFWIPPHERRHALQPDDIVKLVFRIALCDDAGERTEQVERMWVTVKGRMGELYRGLLDNDPACTDGIRSGLEVWFEPRHVIDVYEE